ncbi:MAG: glycosyltransferase family 4 protein [Crocinitomicaceae bacterium]|nr:glycosyltransferase family 4 protein [Crocinitomicaceae bacterium]
MIIGINTRFLLTTKMEGFGWYTYEVCKRLVAQHPEHQFVFFFDRPFDTKFIFSENVKGVIVSPPARHPFLHAIWYEFSLKKALKKYKIDVFFSPDGYLSLGAKIPQIGVIHDINFEHYPKDLPYFSRTYLRYFFPKYARKATKIITVSNYSKADIQQKYGIDASKITVAWNGASELFKPIAEELKSETKLKYSDGEPYFIFVGAIHPRKNVQRLINAFIQFKQSNNSTTKLLIVGTSLWKDSKCQLSIPDEYTKEIIFTGHLPLENLAKLMASALALTYVPYFEGFGIPLLEAMQCGTPIIAGNLTSLPEVAGSAALYCNPFNIAEITEKMNQLEQSNELQHQLRTEGLNRSQLFSWDHSAAIVWKEIKATF